ncbi:hypothetical protein Tdes44962_MAKER03098 [Teratosphaeria destructans]|uniref:Uncharacterized protein n=1 Tax=Teratosphaeria destructans TaxID=418781 RepID=A0A9W7SRR6_9PEZI|nr:hypothetical protein Tdes44962_MAKER03098 [Teratosphaeria destructans]
MTCRLEDVVDSRRIDISTLLRLAARRAEPENANFVIRTFPRTPRCANSHHEDILQNRPQHLITIRTIERLISDFASILVNIICRVLVLSFLLRLIVIVSSVLVSLIIVVDIFVVLVFVVSARLIVGITCYRLARTALQFLGWPLPILAFGVTVSSGTVCRKCS